MQWFRWQLDAYLTLRNNKKIPCVFVFILMHYWIRLTLNTNAISHIKGVGVNWALLRCMEIVSSTDKHHFLVINLASEVLQEEDIS